MITITGRSWSRPVQGENNSARSHLNGKKLGTVACICHSNYRGKLKIGGSQSSQPGQKAKPYLQNNQSKKD
jgi:hypothetical protein